LLEKLQSPIASTKLSLASNVFLFIIKMLAGFFGRSQALVADSLNSLLDIVANIIVWFGIRIAKKPPDEDHPYGHGNADNLAAIFVAIVLFVTGAYIGRESIHAIINGEFGKPTYLATAAAAFTIIVKELLYWYTLKVGKKFRSPAVIANAYDHRTDVIVSLGTLIGIVIAQTEYPILDPIAGLWVTFFILKQGVKIIRENIQTLMVSSPGAGIEDEIKKYIAGLEGVKGVRWIKGRLIGPSYYIDVVVEVRSDMSVKEGHDIASSVKHAVIKAFDDVIDVLVHIEPDLEKI
jgi:cation diffusion facilitator family transporter